MQTFLQTRGLVTVVEKIKCDNNVAQHKQNTKTQRAESLTQCVESLTQRRILNSALSFKTYPGVQTW